MENNLREQSDKHEGQNNQGRNHNVINFFSDILDNILKEKKHFQCVLKKFFDDDIETHAPSSYSNQNPEFGRAQQEIFTGNDVTVTLKTTIFSRCNLFY